MIISSFIARRRYDKRGAAIDNLFLTKVRRLRTSREGAFMGMPSVGEKASDFSLPVTRDKKIGLQDFLGKKNVVLAFYPLDFTGG